MFLFDKLPNNLCECMICISKTIIEGQFKAFLIFLLYTEIRLYVWHRFLFIHFYIMITYIFTCTFNENQLKNMDNICNNYTSILYEPIPTVRIF